jgi:hypothetical protein
MGLSDTIQDQSVKDAVIADCVQLIDGQVATKKGLSGMALKTAYRVVKGIGPNYLTGAIGRLLPDVMAAIDPLWQEGQQTGDPVAYLTQNQSKAADRVLSVTDRRMENSSNKVVRSSYNQLRKSIKGDVEAAIPELSQIIQRHLNG